MQWFLDGGASVTQNDTASYFNNGWNIGTGREFPARSPSSRFMLRAEVDYNRFDATNAFIAQNSQADNGSMQTVTGFLDGGAGSSR